VPGIRTSGPVARNSDHKATGGGVFLKYLDKNVGRGMLKLRNMKELYQASRSTGWHSYFIVGRSQVQASTPTQDSTSIFLHLDILNCHLSARESKDVFCV
jgi:hypothetical protein